MKRDGAVYEKEKSAARAKRRATTLAGQDIGAMPPTRNWDRRLRAIDDFRFFCETYFPHLFTLEWSPDHLRVITKIERVVKHGETLAVAMPRGSGKTTLCEVAVIWAAVTGRHSFVYLVGGTNEKAANVLKGIKTQLRSNKVLLEDFPEVLYPIHCIEGEARRCAGQRYVGVPTQIEWGAEGVTLPTISGSPASGAVIRISGLHGDMRGALHARPDGSQVRPSLVICDDPQTEESAHSPLQTQTRLSIINGAILGMAAPDRPVGVIIPCTVICPGDLADQLLDHEANPLWRGERTKMLQKFPTNERLWEQYAETYNGSIRRGGDGTEATAFYRQHRSDMDEGAIVGWPARYDRNVEISGLQHAMNRKIRAPAEFYAEYQNEPMAQATDSVMVSLDDIVRKCDGRKRGGVPVDAIKTTMFVDVHDKLLYYMVCAWESDFTGCVLEYGTFPDQGRAYFSLRQASRTMARTFQGRSVEEVIWLGLEKLLTDLLARTWPRADGAAMPIDRCLLDRGYKPEIVDGVCRRLRSAKLMPSKGFPVTASSKAFEEYKRTPGQQIGFNWRIPPIISRRDMRYVQIDTNFWKTFVHARLGAGFGARGCLSLYGDPKNLRLHRLLAEHLTAEYAVKTEGRGRTVHVWKAKPSEPDNHWFDCLVGCCAAASMEGIKAPGQDEQRVMRTRKKVRLAGRRRQ